jgi:co-chaperonin GroES (HSP10)
MNNLEKNKLAINQDGLLVETGTKEISLDDIKSLQSIDYVPVNQEIVVQPLTEKEVQTSSGILLPANKKELRAAVVAVGKDSKFKRGQVIRLEPSFFGGQGVPVDYIDGKPVLQVPEHFIKGIYTSVDLTDWK